MSATSLNRWSSLRSFAFGLLAAVSAPHAASCSASESGTVVERQEDRGAQPASRDGIIRIPGASYAKGDNCLAATSRADKLACGTDVRPLELVSPYEMPQEVWWRLGQNGEAVHARIGRVNRVVDDVRLVPPQRLKSHLAMATTELKETFGEVCALIRESHGGGPAPLEVIMERHLWLRYRAYLIDPDAARFAQSVDSLGRANCGGAFKASFLAAEPSVLDPKYSGSAWELSNFFSAALAAYHDAMGRPVARDAFLFRAWLDEDQGVKLSCLSRKLGLTETGRIMQLSAVWNKCAEVATAGKSCSRAMPDCE